MLRCLRRDSCRAVGGLRNARLDVYRRYDASTRRASQQSAHLVLSGAVCRGLHIANLAGISLAAPRGAISFTPVKTRTFGIPGESGPRDIFARAARDRPAREPRLFDAKRQCVACACACHRRNIGRTTARPRVRSRAFMWHSSVTARAWRAARNPDEPHEESARLRAARRRTAAFAEMDQARA